jgi:hypothetical protein
MGEAHLTKIDVINFIKSFLDETGGEWDWDDFISIPIKDKELDKIRDRCASLPEEFPPTAKGQYCNEEGLRVLQEYVEILEDK